MLTNATRLWVAADRICPPFVNCIFFDGTGSFDVKELKKAIEIASDANPGCRYVLRGFLGRSRWIDSGITPPLREVHAPDWDGMGPEGAPFLDEPLSAYTGPTCEVLLVHGDPLRIGFRSHHGVTDGRGLMTWMEDIFRALRGERVIGSDPLISEDELLNIREGVTEKPIPYIYTAPTGRAEGNERGFTWKRMTIQGRFKKLLPKVMLCICQEVWKHNLGNVRFGIPIDMRYRKEDVRSTNNLTNAFYFEVSPETTEEEIMEIIVKRQEQRDDGAYTLEDYLIRYIPIWLLAMVMKKEITDHHKSGCYRYSAVVSNMGRIPLEYFAAGGFTPTAIWGIPPGIEYVPFFIGTASHNDVLELIVSVPKVLATGGRMDRALGGIAGGMASLHE